MPATDRLPVYGYQVVRTYPHDSNAFTQGLQFVDGFLYEGTGLNGRSSVRKVKLETGEVLKRFDVAAQYFGEGITVWKSDLIELTWQSGVAFVYDKDTFQWRRSGRFGSHRSWTGPTTFSPASAAGSARSSPRELRRAVTREFEVLRRVKASLGSNPRRRRCLRV